MPKGVEQWPGFKAAMALAEHDLMALGAFEMRKHSFGRWQAIENPRMPLQNDRLALRSSTWSSGTI